MSMIQLSKGMVWSNAFNGASYFITHIQDGELTVNVTHLDGDKTVKVWKLSEFISKIDDRIFVFDTFKQVDDTSTRIWRLGQWFVKLFKK